MPDARLPLPRRNARFLERMIGLWRTRGLVSAEDAARLRASFMVRPLDWRRLAAYSLWAAVSCFVISGAALLTDTRLVQELVDWFRRNFRQVVAWIEAVPPGAKSAVAWTASAFLYWRAAVHKARRPDEAWTPEALLWLGVTATAGATVWLGRALRLEGGHGSLLFLLDGLVYAAAALALRSTGLWVFALAVLGAWFGAETGYLSGWGTHFLGMNYPLRFTGFGAVLLAAAWAFASVRPLRSFARPTLAAGLLYGFMALWLLSIFGNHGDRLSWSMATRRELLHWSLWFGVAAVAAVIHGLRYDDAVTRGFGLTFLFINLATRYFEIFWNGMHKALFFGLLGAAFWLIHRHAHRVWRAVARRFPVAEDD